MWFASQTQTPQIKKIKVKQLKQTKNETGETRPEKRFVDTVPIRRSTGATGDIQRRKRGDNFVSLILLRPACTPRAKLHHRLRGWPEGYLIKRLGCC